MKSVLPFVLTLMASGAVAQSYPTPVAGVNVRAPVIVDPKTDLYEITDNDAETDGLEVSGSKHITPRWVVSTSATYGLRSTDPRWRLRAATAYAITDRLDVGFSYEHVTGRSGLDSGGDPVSTPGYDVVSAKVRYAFTPHISLTLVGNNLANIHYLDALADPTDAAGNKRALRAALAFDY